MNLFVLAQKQIHGFGPRSHMRKQQFAAVSRKLADSEWGRSLLRNSAVEQ